MDTIFDDDSDNEEQHSLETTFNRATEYLQHLAGTLDQNKLLDFYGLYKQATVGKCNISKPGLFNVQARAKWTAWNNLGSMTKEASMLAYIENLTTIEPNWDNETNTTNKKSKSGWVSVSTPMTDIDDGSHSKDKAFIDHVKEGNMDEILSFFANSIQISENADSIQMKRIPILDEHDESGLTAVHWAADRGHADILDILLKYGASANILDKECNQTPLHYAVSCGHMESIKILLQHGADPKIKDSDELTCFDIALDCNDLNILNMLNEHISKS